MIVSSTTSSILFSNTEIICQLNSIIENNNIPIVAVDTINNDSDTSTAIKTTTTRASEDILDNIAVIASSFTNLLSSWCNRIEQKINATSVVVDNSNENDDYDDDNTNSNTCINNDNNNTTSMNNSSTTVSESNIDYLETIITISNRLRTILLQKLAEVLLVDVNDNDSTNEDDSNNSKSNSNDTSTIDDTIIIQNLCQYFEKQNNTTDSNISTGGTSTSSTQSNRTIIVKENDTYNFELIILLLRTIQLWIRWYIQFYEPTTINSTSTNTNIDTMYSIWNSNEQLVIVYIHLLQTFTPLSIQCGRYICQLLLYITINPTNIITTIYTTIIHKHNLFTILLNVLINSNNNNNTNNNSMNSSDDDIIRLQLSCLKIIHNSLVTYRTVSLLKLLQTTIQLKNILPADTNTNDCTSTTTNTNTSTSIQQDNNCTTDIPSSSSFSCVKERQQQQHHQRQQQHSVVPCWITSAAIPTTSTNEQNNTTNGSNVVIVTFHSILWDLLRWYIPTSSTTLTISPSLLTTSPSPESVVTTNDNNKRQSELLIEIFHILYAMNIDICCNDDNNNTNETNTSNEYIVQILIDIFTKFDSTSTIVWYQCQLAALQLFLNVKVQKQSSQSDEINNNGKHIMTKIFQSTLNNNINCSSSSSTSSTDNNNSISNTNVFLYILEQQVTKLTIQIQIIIEAAAATTAGAKTTNDGATATTSTILMPSSDIIPILSYLNTICTLSNEIRTIISNYIFPEEEEHEREQVQENNNNNNTTRKQSKYNMNPIYVSSEYTIRYKLIQLMSCPLPTVSYIRRYNTELLWTLCNENTTLFINRTGLGNAIQFLSAKGLVDTNTVTI